MTTTYTPLFPDLEGLLDVYRLNDHKFTGGVTVCLHNYNEDFNSLDRTIKSVVNSNRYARDVGVEGNVVRRLILSDQSNEDRVSKNISLLEDAVSRSDDGTIPEVGYFGINDSMYQYVLSEWSEIHNLRSFLEQVKLDGKLKGKGTNMFLASRLTRALEEYTEGSILFLDTDYLNRSARQVVTNALPLSHLGATSVIGVFSRYHKNPKNPLTHLISHFKLPRYIEGFYTERGGRVNVGVGALIDMFVNRGEAKAQGYPCSGDQGWDLDRFDRIHIPRFYDVEMSSRLQGHSSVSGITFNRPICEHDLNYQVEIHGADDSPIGAGKSIDEALKKVSEMTYDIAEGSLATIGIDNLRERWPTAYAFMKAFAKHQAFRFNSWRVAANNRYGRKIPISGGISDDQLIMENLRIFREVSERFYDDIEYRDGLPGKRFIPSAESIREEEGDRAYKKLGYDLVKFFKPINSSTFISVPTHPLVSV